MNTVPRVCAIIVATAAMALVGCARHGMIDDGTSVSYGPSNAGTLLNPASLPISGIGYHMPERWATRGLRHGTDEAVSVVVHVARVVSEASPGSRLEVADLSPQRGGPSAWHRSHQTGRDIDFLFYAVDADGKSIEIGQMLAFDQDGKAVRVEETTGKQTEVRFDVARNWLLVRALIENPVAQIQYVFIADWLKQSLLDHAVAAGEDLDVIQQASFLLHQPSDSLVHNDHMHMRIFCSTTDLAVGCSDRGALRWHKKDYKYAWKMIAIRATGPIGRLVAGQMHALLALSAVPFPGFVPR